MALINTTTTGVLGTTLFGDGQGTLTVQKDGVTINKIGVQPMFSAYQTTAQTGISNWSGTKITFDTVEYNFNNNYASSRFTPTVAGYYHITAGVQIPYASTNAYALSLLYKNGASYKQGSASPAYTGSMYPQTVLSALVYMNGTTDYLEVYSYATGGGANYNTQPGVDRCFFQGYLVRTE